MKGLSIVVPCYNEDSRGMFRERILRLRRYISTLSFPCEVIYVNDGSTDDTDFRLIMTVDYRYRECYYSYEKNKGKGYALRSGISRSRYDKVLIMDADLSVPLENISLFYELCEDNIIVIGTRVFKDKRKWNRRLLTKLSKKFSKHLEVRDSQCGFKMFHKQDYDIISEKLVCNRWVFDIELLTHLKKIGVSIMECDIIWNNHPNSRLHSLSALFTSALELMKIRRSF